MRAFSLVAVLVLYRRRAEESESFVSLRAALEQEAELREGMRLVVYDNSPEAQVIPEMPMGVEYRSDPANSGLAAAYNHGLRLAREVGAEWLLLLDQDTVLTGAFLRELRELLPAMREEVGAVTPKLVYSKGVHSPHYLPRLSHRAVGKEFCGVADREVSAFNSGAAMRVSAIEQMGGFPGRFPMEYLDHATFHALQAAGAKVWVMRSSLEHDLSTLKLEGEDALRRYGRILRAEREFYRGMGEADGRWYRVRRLKQSLGHLLKVKDKRFAVWDLRAALGALGDGGPEG
ncbi:MAG: glycosyltransferase [Acidobacteriaceae bacterium]